MSARSLKYVVAGLSALALSCAQVRHLSSIAGTGDLIPKADTILDVIPGAAECEKLKATPSMEEEYALGGAVALNWVQRGGGLLGSSGEEKLVRYLNVVGRNLGAQSLRPTLRWTFGALRTAESFNAVSSPGGYVFVTLGLLRGVENEAQLAGVLAHEIAHITGKHALARYTEVKVGQCRVASAFKVGKALSGASRLYLSSGAADDLLALLNVPNGAVDLDHHVELLDGLTEAAMDTLVEKGFGQEDEYAADEEAVRLLMSAGYDPREYIEFLGKLPDRGGTFSNHPRKTDRVKRLVALLEASKKPGEGFPDLAVNPEAWVQPPLPPELASVKGTISRGKP